MRQFTHSQCDRCEKDFGSDHCKEELMQRTCPANAKDLQTFKEWLNKGYKDTIQHPQKTLLGYVEDDTT